MIGRVVAGIAVAAALASLPACTAGGSKPGKTVTVTVHRSTPPASPTSPARSTTTSPPSSSPAPPVDQTRLPGTCDTLLPDATVFRAAGVTTLAGVDAFVVGQPEADIGRVGYLNCRYGVTGSGDAAVPKIEIGVSLYHSPAQATARVRATVADYVGHAASAAPVSVSGRPGFMLTGGAGVGYTAPSLVVASGQRTFAVSIATAVATGAKAVTAATAVASLAVARTGG
jgi:hypothetical protein